MKTVGDIDGAVAEGSYDRFYGPQMVKCWIFQLNDAIIRVNVNGYLIGRKVLERNSITSLGVFPWRTMGMSFRYPILKGQVLRQSK